MHDAATLRQEFTIIKNNPIMSMTLGIIERVPQMSRKACSSSAIFHTFGSATPTLSNESRTGSAIHIISSLIRIQLALSLPESSLYMTLYSTIHRANEDIGQAALAGEERLPA